MQSIKQAMLDVVRQKRIRCERDGCENQATILRRVGKGKKAEILFLCEKCSEETR
jgi:hypothetical protein